MTGKVDHTPEGCFTEDTKIKLVDGRSLTIKELLLEQQYKDNYVYTFNETKKIIEPKRIRKVFQTKITKDLVKVTLDNGETITCTPNHRFMLRDGSYEEIQNIQPGTALMPLYTKYPEEGNLKGYRMYYEPMEGKWYFEHRRFCKNIIHKRGYIVHHCNYNKHDNRPKNLDCITKSKHTRIHNNNTLDYNKIAESERKFNEKYKDTKWYKEYHKKQGETLSKRNHEKNKDKIEKQRIRNEQINKLAKELFNIENYNNLSINEKCSIGVKIARHLDSTIQERISKALSNNHKLGRYKNAHKACSDRMWITNGEESRYILKTESIPEGFYKGRKIKHTKEYSGHNNVNRESISKNISERNKNRIWITNGIDNKFYDKNKELPDGYYAGRTRKRNNYEYKNHKVVSIEKIIKPCRVYDLEIEDNHNFALDAGVIVHNSKDLLDSLVGAIYSASMHIKPEEIYQLENIDLITEANINDISSVRNPVNELFSEFATKETTKEDLVDKQNKRIDQEIQVIRNLRKDMTKEENIMFTDDQLLEMIANSTMDNDMLVF